MKMKANWRILRFRTGFVAATSLLVSLATLHFAVSAEPWSFGVMGDTQWPQSQDPDGANPDNVSVSLANVLNQQFIQKSVKFVIQVGDLSDRSGDAAKYTRADASQSLYNQGIGFFPLRGNHDQLGYQYNLDPLYNLNLPAYFNAFPQVKGLGNYLFGAENFSNPSIPVLEGLSYSFDFGGPGNNARFVIVDVEPTSFVSPYGQGYLYSDLYKFTVYKATTTYSGVTTTYDANGRAVERDIPVVILPGTWFRIDSSKRLSTNFYAEDMVNPGQGSRDVYKPIEQYATIPKYDSPGSEFWPGSQQIWVNETLDKVNRGTEHAFVFSHRSLMGSTHVDCFFGSNPGSKAEQQDPFYASLMNNGVKYMISGHDHLHNRAIVKSPDGLSQVQQIISAAASSKFEPPRSLSSFVGQYGDVKQRETIISQEIFNIGYYIYTIDGPRVTVDFYSDSVGNFKSGTYYPHGDPNAKPPVPGTLSVPYFNFVKKETWGYSLNGKEFLIAQGQSYIAISDIFEGTTVKILSGINTSTATDYVNRALTKCINTGWRSNGNNNFNSNILTLWGMASFGTEITDTYTLSMTFALTTTGACALMTKNARGEWVHAVELNNGGIKKFVAGPYKQTYGLGTYGIDHTAKTAWAVTNHAGDFVVHKSADGDQDDDGDVDDVDVNIISSNRNQPATVLPLADLDNDGKITSLDVRKAILLKTIN